MGSNGYRKGGSVYRGSMDDMEAYDRCPPVLRLALANSNNDWSAAWAFNHQKKHGWSKTVKAIREADRGLVKKKKRSR